MASPTVLKIVWLSDDIVVDEATDEGLWKRALAEKAGISLERATLVPAIQNSTGPALSETADGSIDRFAKQIGATRDQVEGACDPLAQSPYLRLDAHFWAAFRRNVPATGSNAISGAALAAT